MRLWNIYSFFVTYADLDNWVPADITTQYSLLDRWILSNLQIIVQNVTKGLIEYDAYSATAFLEKFVDDAAKYIETKDMSNRSVQEEMSGNRWRVWDYYLFIYTIDRDFICVGHGANTDRLGKSYANEKNIPYVIQLNKRDIESAISIADFKRLMELPPSEFYSDGTKVVYPTVALQGDNVRECFEDLMLQVIMNFFLNR